MTFAEVSTTAKESFQLRMGALQIQP